MTRITTARRLLGAVLVAVAGMAGEAGAQEARVLGRVTDGVGNPVADATVTLVPDDGAAGPRTAVSGQTGGFQFAAVAPGTYTLRVERAGYGVREQPIVVREGRVVTPVVRLTGSGAGRGAVATRRPRG